MALALALVLAAALGPALAPNLRERLLPVCALLLKPMALVSQTARARLLSLESLTPAEARAFPFRDVWREVGSYYFWVLAPIEALFLLFVIRRDRGLTPAKARDAWSLVEENAKSFPCLLPLLKTGPITGYPLASGPWALGQSPILFAVSRSLLLNPHKIPYRLEEVANPKTGQALSDSRALGAANLLHAKDTLKAFAAQLGKRFDGDPQTLPFHERALAAAFLSHANDDKDEAFRIFDSLSVSWRPDDLSVLATGIDETLARHRDLKRPELERHASYVNVYFMALLKLARAKGALPSSLWIWLKPTARTLFYSLNQTGGRAAWSEAAGVFSHFMAEEWAGETLVHPQLSLAQRGLTEALESETWLPAPPKSPALILESSPPTTSGFAGEAGEILREESLRRDLSPERRKAIGEALDSRVDSPLPPLTPPPPAEEIESDPPPLTEKKPAAPPESESDPYAIDDFSGDPLALANEDDPAFAIAPSPGEDA
jgi:hypothetical protein